MEQPSVRDNTKEWFTIRNGTYSPGLMSGHGLPRYMRQRQDGIRPRETRWGTERLAACLCLYEWGHNLGGLDGETMTGHLLIIYDEARQRGSVSNAMMLNAIKNDVVFDGEPDYRILEG